VQYINNNTLGYIIIADLTQNLALAQPFTLVPPPNANPTGNTVEWIMECPNGGPPGTQLAQFTPVVFTTALACGIDNAGDLQTVTSPLNADKLIIGTDPNNPDNMNLTNVTLGQFTVTIDFVG
jgi:hypothetical protein